MISAWTKHLKTQEEKEKFNNSLIGSKMILERQAELLKEMLADLDRTETDTRIYDIPNWDYRQADTNGYRRCLKQIQRLINLDHKE